MIFDGIFVFTKGITTCNLVFKCCNFVNTWCDVYIYQYYICFQLCYIYLCLMCVCVGGGIYRYGLLIIIAVIILYHNTKT